MPAEYVHPGHRKGLTFPLAAVTAPPQPLVLPAASSAESGQLLVVVVPPASDGNSPLATYTALAVSASGNVTVELAATATNQVRLLPTARLADDTQTRFRPPAASSCLLCLDCRMASSTA